MCSYCPRCMTAVQPGAYCPGCGMDPATYQPASHHFPPGRLLHDRYLVGQVLGEGGFGITYLGIDVLLERKVAIKEYFPNVFVRRESSLTLEVTCYTNAKQPLYEKGRDQFLQEARVMARLDKLPEIVQVLDFFAANSTAYIVMEFLEGDTLRTLLSRQGRIPAPLLLGMLEPVLRAVDVMHRAGIIHRDISPDNLMLLPSGLVKLLDFGCARDAEGDRTMTVMLKHGYAPMEQYTGHNQGPWTDLYALCATMYACLTGQVPPQALERLGKAEDPLVPPNALGVGLMPDQERALLRGLTVEPSARLQSAAELYAGLYGRSITGVPVSAAEKTAFFAGEQPFDHEPPEPKPQAGYHSTEGPSREAKDYITGAWSMKFPQPPGDGTQNSGKAAQGTWDDGGTIHRGPKSSSGKTATDAEQNGRRETNPYPPTGSAWPPPSAPEEDALKVEKKQRRSIRVWAVWLFVFVGSGIGQLTSFGFTTGHLIVALIAAAIGIVPFAVNAARKLKGSNNNPRVQKTLFISLGVVAGLSLLVLIGTLAEQQAQNPPDPPLPSSDTGSGGESQIQGRRYLDYTKGTFDGTTYVNEWANLMFVVPEGYYKAGDDFYNQAEANEAIDCGLYLMNQDNNACFIWFEKLSFASQTEVMYLDASINATINQYEESGVSASSSHEYGQFASGVSFTCGQIELVTNGATFVQSVYVKKYGDIMCVISAIGPSQEDNDQLISGFTRYDGYEGVFIDISDDNEYRPFVSTAAEDYAMIEEIKRIMNGNDG